MRTFMTLMAVLLLAGLLHGQLQDGDIYGKVTDAKGVPLPGVTLILTNSTIGTLEAVTNSRGEYCFKAIPPAEDYQLRSEIEDYKKSTLRNVRVLVGVSLEINLRLQPGVMTEEAPAQVDSPGTDRRRLHPEKTASFSELQTLPSGRDPFAFLALAPGIQTDRQNSAGAESGLVGAALARGQINTGDNTWNLDGINVTDNTIKGQQPTYWDFDSFEQMNVTLGGDVTTQTGGVNLNLVSRRGGNRPSIGGRFYVTDSYFQDNNLSDTLIGQGAGVDRVRGIKDFGFNLSGPLFTDILNYWFSYSVQDIKITNPAGVNEDTQISNYAFKLNMQPVPADRFSIQLYSGSRSADPLSSRNHFGTPLFSMQNEYAFFDRFFLSLKFAAANTGLKLLPVIDPSMVHFQFRDMAAGGLISGSDSIYSESKPKRQYALQATYYQDDLLGGNHEVLLGFEFTHMHDYTISGDSSTGTGYVAYDFNTPQIDLDGDGVNDIPGAEWRKWHNTRPVGKNDWLSQYSLYLQDSATFGKFMVRAGLRFDLYLPELKLTSFDGMPKADVALADVATSDTLSYLSQLFPAATASAMKPTEYRWNSFSPRLGLSWDVEGNGKTIFKLSLARYGDVMSADTADLFAPNGGGYMDFWWDDVNGDHIAQFSELYWVKQVGQALVPHRVFSDQAVFDISDPLNYQNTAWGGYEWSTADTAQAATRKVDWFGSPNTYEALAVLEKELTRDLVVSAGATYRLIDRFTWDVPYYPDSGEVVDSPSWYKAIGTIPATILTDQGPKSTGDAAGRTWYSLGDRYQPTAWTMLKKRPGLSYHYWGVDLILNKKLANRWMASASLTLQNQHANYGAGSYTDPTSIWAYNQQAYAPFVSAGDGQPGQYVYSRWLVKGSGLYQLPWDVTVSAAFSGREGNIVEQGFWIFDQILCNPAASPTWVAVSKFGSKRLPAVWELNLRAEKRIKISDHQAVYLSIDLFNVFNRSVIDRQYQESWGTAYFQNGVFKSFIPDSTSGKAYSSIDPRAFRLGVRFQL